MHIGVELELGLLLVLQTILITVFARFEVETPIARRLIKWLVVDVITLALYFSIGHWALVFPIVGMLPGVIFHWTWCRRNGIDPLRATPRRRYYALRGWPWPA
mgnify:FL=1